MPRKGENIYKRKDGRWEGRFIKGYHQSKIRYGYVYARSYKEVREKLLKARERNLSQPSWKNEIVPDDILRNVFPVWFESIAGTVKESTRVKYQNLYLNYLDPTLGGCKLTELSEDRVQACVNMLLMTGGRKGEGLTGKTVSDAIRLLKKVMRYAAQRNYRINTTGLAVSVKTKSTRLRVLSMREQEILISYIKEHPTASNLGILLSLFTGLRVGELCALTWEDINLDEGTIHIHRTMQRLATSEPGCKTRIVISSPKSECSERVIPLPGIVRDLIEEIPDPACFFLTNSSWKYVEPRTMQYRFARVLKECGIQHVKFHTLRHTFATRCVEIGFDLKSLSEILGHANINITLNRYVHPSFELKRQNISKLSELFSA